MKSTGFINNSLIYFVIKKISNVIYASADKLIVQSEGFKRILKKEDLKILNYFIIVMRYLILKILINIIK